MKQLAVRDLAAHCAAASTSQASRHIPLASIPDMLDGLDPAQPIVCFCHHGVRSLQVVAFLERQGFESVYNLAGGIDAWSLQVDPRVPRY